MPEFQENSSILAVEHLTTGFHRLTLSAPRIAGAARPGQFVMASCGPTFDPLLRRPFSIHRITAGSEVQLLIKTVGQGTRWLSELRPGDSLDLIGPLGQGFRWPAEEPVALVGGGIGIAPLLFLADALRARIGSNTPPLALLGARTGEELNRLTYEFVAAGCEVHTATDDGTLGYHGHVGDLLPGHLPRVRQVYTCGPHAMMAAVARACGLHGVACQVSLEAHMACGLGACLGCTIHGADNTYRHVCSHGPVFQAEEVAWNP